MKYLFILPLIALWHVFYWCIPLLILALPWAGPKSKCYIYAFGKLFQEGGSLIITKSDHGWWNHIQHRSREGMITEYVPKEGKGNRLFPPPFFNGYVNHVE